MTDVSQTAQYDRSLATEAARLGRASAHDGTVLAGRETDAAAAADAVTAAAPSAAEAGATAARLRVLAEAGALLQTADAALAKIGDRLDRLADIAEDASDEDLSAFERGQLDATFGELRSEIDTIAGAARFNGEPILQGGTGSGGGYAVSTAVDEETGGLQAVEIPEVSVEELDAGLATAGVASEAQAEAASDSVEAAQASLAAIQTSVASQLRQIGAESSVNRAAAVSDQADAARAESLEEVYQPPELVKDIAEEVARQGGIDLSGNAERTLRQLLLSLTTTGFGQRDGGSRLAPDAPAPAANSSA